MSEIDRGAIFNHELRIEPGSGGSFIVRANVDARGEWPMWGFSNVKDLMSWLSNHAEGFVWQRDGIKQPAKGDAS